MKLVVHLLIRVMVVTVLLPQLSLEENNKIDSKVEDVRYNMNCSNSSTCPTWFMCNSHNNCQCGNGQSNIVCDDKTLTSQF